MTRPAVIRWALAIVAVLAVASIGLGANLAVLRSSDSDARIGSMSARGQVADLASTPSPAAPGASPDATGSTTSALPTPTSTYATPGYGHRNGRDHDDD